MKDAGGNITEETVARHSKVVGHLDFLDKMYEEADFFKSSKEYKYDHTDQINVLIELLSSEHVFSDIPGREHKSFPQFTYSNTVARPKKLHDTLQAYSKKLNKLARVTKMWYMATSVLLLLLMSEN